MMPREVALKEEAAPVSFLEKAMALASDVDSFERLVRIHQEMEATAAEKAFDEALAGAQAEIKPVLLSGYNPSTKKPYATFEDAISAVQAPFAKHKITCRFEPEVTDGKLTMFCILSHDGFSRRTPSAPMPIEPVNRGMNSSQAGVAATTYAKRNALFLAAALRTAVSTDDDGQEASVAPPALINSAQYIEIVGLLEDKGIEIDEFLKAGNVETIESLAMENFERAKAWILGQKARVDASA